MLRFRPMATVAVLLLTALAAPASQEMAAADGRPLPVVAQRSPPEVAAPVQSPSARAPDAADAAEAEGSTTALALLLAGLGAVGLMASRLRRPD
ncbi:hypothetical protein [Pseudaquabacterium pictum]|uniref:Gram-positive cocci surface proteins LPxTG domain-containing protein n=1 Tax=Pseudaquabacterium pictum TaxID=2315236 RepID=A0A480AQK9_9BURK|nr:hypothetical protein [Rubrivivax pictus]GCL63723.1 hypothetical protein AQPW35_28040 [Rubrivivax pictus]